MEFTTHLTTQRGQHSLIHSVNFLHSTGFQAWNLGGKVQMTPEVKGAERVWRVDVLQNDGGGYRHCKARKEK